MSIYALLYYRQNGSMPGATASTQQPIEDQTKYAFSSNPHEHDEFNTSDPEIGAHGHQNPHVAADDGEDAEYEVLHPQPEEEAAGPHWSQGHSELGADDDTSYHGAGAYGAQPQENPFRNPSPYREHSPYRDPGSGGYEHPPALQVGSAGDPFRDDLGLSHDAAGYAAGRGGRVSIPDVNDFRPR